MYRSRDKDADFGRAFMESIAGSPINEPPEPDNKDLFDMVMKCAKNMKYSRIRGTKLWATVDKGVGFQGSHGGVYWKIYKKVGKQFVHQYEADEFFNVINKHKGPKGKIVDIKGCSVLKKWR